MHRVWWSPLRLSSTMTWRALFRTLAYRNRPPPSRGANRLSPNAGRLPAKIPQGASIRRGRSLRYGARAFKPPPPHARTLVVRTNSGGQLRALSQLTKCIHWREKHDIDRRVHPKAPASSLLPREVHVWDFICSPTTPRPSVRPSQRLVAAADAKEAGGAAPRCPPAPPCHGLPSPPFVAGPSLPLHPPHWGAQAPQLRAAARRSWPSAFRPPTTASTRRGSRSTSTGPACPTSRGCWSTATKTTSCTSTSC